MMRVSLIPIEKKQVFDDFVLAHTNGNLWQSWKWGEFQAGTSGRGKFWAVLIEDAVGAIKGSALLVRQGFPFRKCWFLCMYGPVMNFETGPVEIWREFIDFVSQLAKKEMAVYLRCEFGVENSEFKIQQIPGNDRWRPAHTRYSPEWTLVVDLTCSEAEILTQMKPKGRYNIRLAEKKGMSVVSKIGSQAVSAGFVKRFFGLLKETTQRDGFSGHGLAYYESMLETLGDDAEVFVADYQGKSLAAMIVTYFKNTATYYYGASSNEMRHLMAPYLLQWRAMQEAKRRGMKRYDLFGISPSKSHTWAKVTEFKLKFGGQTVQYAPAVEVVFDRVFYWAMRGAKGLGLRG